jgi:L-ascorbate metabolism protein UlaG (beta-lactamase superfamily)
MIVPQGAAGPLRRWGFQAVTELTSGSDTTVGALRISATPANHSNGRPPFGRRTECLGFVVRGSRTIYFAGDTDLFPEMATVSPHLDLALLPVWGWGPTLGPGHLDPMRAAEALTLLRPRAAVPIHWGTLFPIGLSRWRAHLLSAPPLQFAQHAAVRAPSVAVHVLHPGQSLGMG